MYTCMCSICISQVLVYFCEVRKFCYIYYTLRRKSAADLFSIKMHTHIDATKLHAVLTIDFTFDIEQYNIMIHLYLFSNLVPHIHFIFRSDFIMFRFAVPIMYHIYSILLIWYVLHRVYGRSRGKQQFS